MQIKKNAVKGFMIGTLVSVVLYILMLWAGSFLCIKRILPLNSVDWWYAAASFVALFIGMTIIRAKNKTWTVLIMPVVFWVVLLLGGLLIYDGLCFDSVMLMVLLGSVLATVVKTFARTKKSGKGKKRRRQRSKSSRG